MRSMAYALVPVSSARISVCPEWRTPAAASASLLTGAVTIPAIAPSWERRTPRSMYS